MLKFGQLEPRPVCTEYVARVTDRDAYRRAQQIDRKLIAQIQPSQAQQETARPVS